MARASDVSGVEFRRRDKCHRWLCSFSVDGLQADSVRPAHNISREAGDRRGGGGGRMGLFPRWGGTGSSFGFRPFFFFFFFFLFFWKEEKSCALWVDDGELGRGGARVIALSAPAAAAAAAAAAKERAGHAASPAAGLLEPNEEEDDGRESNAGALGRYMQGSLLAEY